MLGRSLLVSLLAATPLLELRLDAPALEKCGWRAQFQRQLELLEGPRLDAHAETVLEISARGVGLHARLTRRNGEVLAERDLAQAGCASWARQVAVVVDRVFHDVRWSGSVSLGQPAVQAPTPDIPVEPAPPRAAPEPPPRAEVKASEPAPAAGFDGGLARKEELRRPGLERVEEWPDDPAQAARLRAVDGPDAGAPAGSATLVPTGAAAVGLAGSTQSAGELTQDRADGVPVRDAHGPAMEGELAQDRADGVPVGEGHGPPMEGELGAGEVRRGAAGAPLELEVRLEAGYSVLATSEALQTGPALSVSLASRLFYAAVDGTWLLAPSRTAAVVIQGVERGQISARSGAVRLGLGLCLRRSLFSLCAGPSATLWLEQADASGQLFSLKPALGEGVLVGAQLRPALTISRLSVSLLLDGQGALLRHRAEVDGTTAGFSTPAWIISGSLFVGLRLP
jgi:hypothetical protein